MLFTGSNTTTFGVVRDVDISYEVKRIETTRLGDSNRTFIQGSRTFVMLLSIVGRWKRPNANVLDIDDIIGTIAINGRFAIHHTDYADGITTVSLMSYGNVDVHDATDADVIRQRVRQIRNTHEQADVR